MANRYLAPLAAVLVIVFMLLMLAFLLPARAFASEGSQMVPLSLEKRIKEADIVLEGEVISQKSFWDARHENIYTSNIIRVYKLFKGDVQAEEVEVITEGGAVGLKRHVFSTALHLGKGQQGIFFLDKDQPLRNTPGGQRLSTRVYGNQQGLVKYNLERGTARDVYSTYDSVQEVYKAVTSETGASYRTVTENKRLRSIKQHKTQQQQKDQQGTAAAPVITGFSPTVANAGTGAILTITGTGFGSARGSGSVQFRNSDDGGETFITPLASEYVSWSNTRIQVRIPSTSEEEEGGTAGTGEIRVTASDGSTSTSTARLTIEYAYANIPFEGRAFQPILSDIDGQGGYTIQFAPSIQNRNAAQEGFRRAINSWVCNTQVNWKIGSPTTVDRAADDGRSIVRFAPESETGESVLARTISRYEGCSDGVDTLFWVTEFDMEINSEINWQYGPGPPANRQFDYETVVLHELGHAHQLGHVILPRAVMHYAVEFEVLFRDLSTADIAGASFVMARSAGENFCEQPPIVPEPEGDCNLAPEIISFDASFQGSQVVAQWQAEEEQDVDYYTVQRSADGINWTDAGDVEGADLPAYSFTDPNPLPDISFYRVEVMYTDGSSRFSPRARVLDPTSLRVLRVYPNPVSPVTNVVRLLYLVQANTTVSIQLYSTAGSLVREYNAVFTDVNAPAELDLGDLAAGLYILKWQERNRSGTFRLLKL